MRATLSQAMSKESHRPHILRESRFLERWMNKVTGLILYFVSDFNSTAYCIWSAMSLVSNCTRWSRSLGHVCYVLVNRDPWYWDWRLRLEIEIRSHSKCNTLYSKWTVWLTRLHTQEFKVRERSSKIERGCKGDKSPIFLDSIVLDSNFIYILFRFLCLF